MLQVLLTADYADDFLAKTVHGATHPRPQISSFPEDKNESKARINVKKLVQNNVVKAHVPAAKGGDEAATFFTKFSKTAIIGNFLFSAVRTILYMYSYSYKYVFCSLYLCYYSLLCCNIVKGSQTRDFHHLVFYSKNSFPNGPEYPVGAISSFLITKIRRYMRM